MKFKNRKASVLAVLTLLLVVQIVFSGIHASEAVGASGSLLTENDAEATADDAGQPVDDVWNTDPVTEEEVVLAELNVVYRSAVTSTEAVDVFEDSIDNGDFSNKIVSYTCDELNVYAQADAASEVVGIMYSGSEGTIVERGDEWTKITSGDVTGYVRNVAVLFGEEAEVIASIIGDKTATVFADNTPVYDEASAVSEQIGTLAADAVIDVYDEVNNYLLVLINGEYGYVNKNNVTISYGLPYAWTIAAVKAKEAEEEAKRIEAAKQAAKEEAAKQAAAATSGSAVSTTTRSAYSATEEEIHLLAAIVYWEAGWEPAEGQLAVANVVLNRVLSSQFKQNTIKTVIYAAGQFTGVAVDGEPSSRFQAILNMTNEQLNARGCYDAAIRALNGENNIGSYAFFISTKQANYAKYTSYTVINNHCFYAY